MKGSRSQCNGLSKVSLTLITMFVGFASVLSNTQISKNVEQLFPSVKNVFLILEFEPCSFKYRIFRKIGPPFSQFLGLPKCSRVLCAEYIHAYTFYKIGVPKSKGGLTVGGSYIPENTVYNMPNTAQQS
jgi:hypothetical protein